MTPIRCTASSPRLPAAALLLVLILLLPAAAPGSSHVFFEDTQYPLEVHVLRGRQPGPTVMVQGGIQGDEVAGYLAAQRLTEAEVERGRLIIVPRANAPSISRRTRQVNVDLNRRFDRDRSRFYEDRLARVISHYLGMADAFIHLHEGSGFYSPTYVNHLRNPRRWGQSVIIDTASYRSIPLADYAEGVLKRLNPQVDPADYRFALFNTRTFDDDSPYSQSMSKSLTCHALTAHGIPALAIEVSKNIDRLDWKVREQLKATRLFLETFGVHIELPEAPPGHFDKHAGSRPGLRVNGRPLEPDEPLRLSLGDTVRLDAISSYAGAPRAEPALFAPGGELDLSRTPFTALRPLDGLEVRADGRSVGKVKVDWTGEEPRDGEDGLLVLRRNGRQRFLAPGQSLDVIEGDRVVLEGVWGSPREEVLNVKGIVTSTGTNHGQDAGKEIVLEKRAFIQRYLEPAGGERVRVRIARETEGAPRQEYFLEMRPREVQALMLVRHDGEHVLLPWRDGSTFPLAPGTYRLAGAWSNGESIRLTPMLDGLPLDWGSTLRVGFDEVRRFELRQASTFRPMGSMRLSAAALAMLGEATRTH